MIIGLGIDTINVSRVTQAAESECFMRKCFSLAEVEMYERRGKNAQFLAGNFAAKEAVAKALGTGFTTFWPCDIEVLRDEAGKPYVDFVGNAKAAIKVFGECTVHVSITNTKEVATAVAVMEVNDDGI